VTKKKNQNEQTIDNREEKEILDGVTLSSEEVKAKRVKKEAGRNPTTKTGQQ